MPRPVPVSQTPDTQTPDTQTPHTQAPQPQDTGIQAARPLELFFDLVFVFAVSQFAKWVAHPHGWADYAQAGLVFLSVAWMYTAFVWLTSNIQLDDSEFERWNLLLGMLCFFGMAVGIPHLAGGNGVLFGLSFLAAMVLRLLTFARTGEATRQATAQVAPLNLLTGLLICVACFLPSPWRWWLWVVALPLPFAYMLLSGRSNYPLSFSTRHFVERHGLMLIIALGEGIIALGTGAAGHDFSKRVLAYVVSGLALLATMWWAYFGLNQHASEHKLLHTPLEQRAELAGSFGSAHFPLVAGCILVAASLEVGVLHPLAHASATIGNMSAGAALYFGGLIFMRSQLGLPAHLHLWGGLVLALLSALVGLHYGALWQMVMLVVTLLWVGFSKVPGEGH